MNARNRILLSVLGILIALLSAELLIRIFAPQTTLAKAQVFSFKCFVEGTYRWIRLAPDKTCTLQFVNDNTIPVTTVKTNSMGLRNPEITPKPPNTKRILFIGDSFTMGWGVGENEAFPRLVESQLNDNSLPVHIETVNAGWAGSGPSGYWLYLTHYALETDPDIIVIGFYLGNDVTDVREHEWVSVDQEGLPEVVRSKTMYVDSSGQLRLRKLPVQFGIPYLRESHLYILLMKRLFGLVSQEPRTANSIVTPLLCQFKSWCHDIDTEKAKVQKLFLAMKRFSDLHNKHLIIAILPVEFQVDDYTRPKYGVDIPLLPAEKRYPDTEWGAFFAQNGIDSVDLLPELEKQQNTGLWYIYDDHWNAQGHHAAAGIISNKLRALIAGSTP